MFLTGIEEEEEGEGEGGGSCI
jgi:hypothetical protein